MKSPHVKLTGHARSALLPERVPGSWAQGNVADFSLMWFLLMAYRFNHRSNGHSFAEYEFCHTARMAVRALLYGALAWPSSAPVAYFSPPSTCLVFTV
jgi:hypothetical protein